MNGSYSVRMNVLHKSLLLLICSPVLLLLPGCLPQRVLIDLNPNPTSLEKAVMEEGAAFSSQVALIGVEGVISESSAEGGLGGLGSSGLSLVDRVTLRLKEAESDKRVKAVVLRINSPGGTVSASETLYEELLRFRASSGKPIVVSMGALATSGGYYAALAGDEILAQRSTITGSIGVLMQTFNVSGGMTMIGVEGRAVTSANNKDIANPFEPPLDEHYEILQEIVDTFYIAFTERVQERRGEHLVADHARYLDGRIVAGEEALNAGLIDALGGVRDAFDRAQELAGISDASLIIWHSPGRRPASIYGGASTSIQPRSGVQGVLDNLPDAKPYYIWRPGALSR